MTDPAAIGDSPRRREDVRFVTGRGACRDDLRFDGVTRAIADAVGVSSLNGPASAFRVWQAMRGAST